MKTAVATRMPATTSRSRPGLRPSRRGAGGGKVLLHGQALLGAGAGQQQDEDAGHLQDGQRGRRGQVEQDGRLTVDLDLEGRVAGPAQQQHDAERGDREEEDDGGRRDDGRAQQRPRDLPEGTPGRSAQDTRRLLRAHVEVLPEAAHQPHDDGHVVEDVGDDDGRGGAIEADLRHVRPQDRLRDRVERAAWAEQRQERRTDHDGGQHEGHDRQRPRHPPAGEVEAGEDPGDGQAQQQRQQRGDRRQAEREEHDVQHVRLSPGVDDATQRQAAAGGHAEGQDVGHRPQEEEAHERQRRGRQQQGRGARHRSTMSVHSRIQASRPAAMAAGSRLRGAVGPKRVPLEDLGQRHVGAGRGRRTWPGAARPASRAPGDGR